MSNFSELAIAAYYNGELINTALGRKIRTAELEEELAVEYAQGELS